MSNGSDNLTDAIRDNAAGGRQVTVDGTTTAAHSLPDQIAADKYLRGLDAQKKRRSPLKLFRTRPGGAA